jgi:hypothetical protein
MFDQAAMTKYVQKNAEFIKGLERKQEELTAELAAAESLAEAKDNKTVVDDAPPPPQGGMSYGYHPPATEEQENEEEEEEEEEEESSDDSDTDEQKKPTKGPAVYRRTSVQRQNMTFPQLDDSDFSKTAKEIMYVTYFDSVCCSMFIRL